MELYKDKEKFIDAIREASQSLKISEALVEKDYFVMLVLSKLNKAIPGLLFKGGTCCSHAYKAIDRFSEDIDLSLDETHFGRNHNSRANKTVIEVCDKLGFKIINREEIEKHSHGSFNRFYIEYPISFSSESVKPFIQVETTFYMRSYPNEIKPVNSLVGDWLVDNGNKEVASMFGLMPFNVCVQKLERTFIDKVFAICDYYERKEPQRNSRHLYDLYKISTFIDLKEPSLKQLIHDVREDRKKNERCISAKEGYSINDTLKNIMSSKYFETDYKEVTMLLLTKVVDYETTMTIIEKIINTDLF